MIQFVYFGVDRHGKKSRLINQEKNMEPRDFVVKAAKGISGSARLLAFLCPDAPPDALAKAQRSNDWRERAAIALNPNTPEIVLQRLANEGNAVVRALAKQSLKNRQSS